MATVERRWDILERRGINRRFIKHGIIYTPDEPATELYVVREGCVALNLLSPEGRTLTVRVVKAGEVFGHAALLSDGAFDTFAQALEPTTLAVVRRDLLETLMHDHPALSLALMDDLGRHSQRLAQRLGSMLKSAPARLASVLLELAQWGERDEPSTGRWTHQELADMINAYRETVTKILNEFRTAKLIEMDRKGVRLLNVARLQELSRR